MRQEIAGTSKQDEYLRRAIEVAPALIASAGIKVGRMDGEVFEQAVHAVMGPLDCASSQRNERSLSRIAETLQPELERHGLRWDLVALAAGYLVPRADATYALGLAVGLVFAGGVRSVQASMDAGVENKWTGRRGRSPAADDPNGPTYAFRGPWFQTDEAAAYLGYRGKHAESSLRKFLKKKGIPTSRRFRTLLIAKRDLDAAIGAGHRKR